MNNKLLSIVIYVIGMLSFFLVDFIIARYETTEAIAGWALIKSIVMIGGTIVLFGMDQVMVRLPQQAKSILKRSYLQIAIAVLSYGAVISSMGLLHEGLWTIVAIFLLALSTLFFGFYRSRFSLLSAQIVTNGWKPFFLLVLIIFLSFEIPRNYSVVFIVAISLSLLMTQLQNKGSSDKLEDIKDHEYEKIVGQYGLGARFFISLMSLNLSIYLEQILLNNGSHTLESTIYFSHFAIILPLMMLFNGYIGFLLGPYIRKNIAKFDSFLATYWWVFPLLALSLGTISFLLSMYLYSFLLNGKSEFIHSLALIITSIGILRVIYILPSSYLGVVASKRVLNRFIAINVVGIGVLVGGFYVFYHMTDNALYSIAYASLLNWVIRSSYGSFLVWDIWKKRKLGVYDVSK